MKSIDLSRKNKYNKYTIMSVIISSLSKHFLLGGHRKEVLKDLYLDVRSGEIFLLKGDNGSGKTTLLKILSTLITPSSGSIIVNDIDIAAEPRAAKAQIGLIYNFENFYQVLTVQKNLEFYGRIYSLSGNPLKIKIDSLLDIFSLSEYKQARINQCSSGVKQKIAFARAFLADPKVILVDEFTKSLDLPSIKTVSEFIKSQVREQNKTCIIVSHEQEPCNDISDRTGRLENGKIVQG
jgi:ABC-type multidrug transport system ATPase subunit